VTAATGNHERWVEIDAAHPRRVVDVRELWRFRDLVGILALRDLQVRYKQAALGVVWAVLQPLVGTATMVILFHRLAHLSTNGLPYLPFTLVGFSGWTYFSSTITTMTGSFVANSALVTKVYYPRIATPLAGLLTPAIDLGVALVVAEIAVGASGIVPPVQLALLPLWLVALAATSFAVGLPLATLNVRYRDVGPVVAFAVQLMLFVTPVAYASNVIGSAWQPLYHLNPMVAVLDGLRWSMIGGSTPGRWALISLGADAALLVLGFRMFVRNERRFADVI
jgi:ABC-type polysaccharide/polyol phosphate export permease